MNGREMSRKRIQSKQTPKYNVSNRTNRWSELQADALCPSSKKQSTMPKATSIKHDFIFSLRRGERKGVRKPQKKYAKKTQTASAFFFRTPKPHAPGGHNMKAAVSKT